MKFRPRVQAAYAPAQAATGEDADGKPVLLLFVPQWNDLVQELALDDVNVAGNSAVESQWAFSREVGLPLFFCRWPNGKELAVSFSPAMIEQILPWWEQHRWVDVVFCAGPVQQAELPALGFAARDQATPAWVRVPSAPFMTL